MSRNRAVTYDLKLGQIRSVAASLFAANGFSRTSMAELARECGVSKALLYHYFTSKEALLFDILEAYLENLQAALPTNPADSDNARAHLRGLIHSLLVEYRQADNTHKLLLHDQDVLPEEQQQILRQMEKAIVRHFSDALENAAAAAGHPTPPNGPRAMMLLGILNWTYTWFRDDGALSLDEYCDLICDSMIASLAV